MFQASSSGRKRSTDQFKNRSLQLSDEMVIEEYGRLASSSNNYNQLLNVVDRMLRLCCDIFAYCTYRVSMNEEVLSSKVHYFCAKESRLDWPSESVVLQYSSTRKLGNTNCISCRQQRIPERLMTCSGIRDIVQMRQRLFKFNLYVRMNLLFRISHKIKCLMI